jgi:hypothetical protein
MKISKTVKLKKKEINTNFSPKTYLKTILYEKVEPVRGKKRASVSEEDFEILEFHEYERVLLVNYNVKQLKMILKHYKQPVSGNKPNLIHRIYNFLKFSSFSTIIQKNIRGWQRRIYFKIGGLHNKKLCVNDTDFLTLLDINKVPYYQFYSFKDKDNFVYGFNIKSLYNLMMQTDGNLKNPYNRKEFPKDIIKNIRKFIKLSHIFKYPIKITLKNNNDSLSHKKKIAFKTLSIFHRIDTFGHITDTSWFLSLNRIELVRFLRELQDIWEYRANLSNIVKRQICPPAGNPFHGINIHSLIHKNSETLQRNILYIMENLISRGINKDSKALGAFYILAALTLVSHSAATALPWLYQSVAQI